MSEGGCPRSAVTCLSSSTLAGGTAIDPGVRTPAVGLIQDQGPLAGPRIAWLRRPISSPATAYYVNTLGRGPGDQIRPEAERWRERRWRAISNRRELGWAGPRLAEGNAQELHRNYLATADDPLSWAVAAAARRSLPPPCYP